MSQYARRVDGNQKEIVDALRNEGALVFDTHNLGKGYPDITVIYNGKVILVEVKQEGESLTEDEKKFHESALEHGYEVCVWHNVREAFYGFYERIAA